MVGAYGSLLQKVLNDLLDNGTGSLIFLLKPIDQLEDIAITANMDTSQFPPVKIGHKVLLTQCLITET
jgi:hypothetical protein